MSKRNNFLVILSREYLTRVRKPSFILTTLLIPIFYVIIGTVPMLLSEISDEEHLMVYVYDQTGKYAKLFTDTESYTFFAVSPQESQESLREKQHSGDIPILLTIDEDLLQNPKALSLTSERKLSAGLEQHIGRILSEYLTQEKIALQGIPDLERIMQDVRIHQHVPTYTIGKSLEDERTEVSAGIFSAIGVAFSLLIYMFIMIYGMMVMASVLEEKKNRVMEVILSSTSPSTLMSAKVAGIGLLGLTQIAIWTIMAVVIFSGLQAYYIGTAGVADLSALAGQEGAAGMVAHVSNIIAGMNLWGMLALFVVYFILGFLFYASMLAALGACISSDEDAQYFTTPTMITLMIAMYVGMAAGQAPNGDLAVWSSMFPLFTPMVMVARLPYDVPTWQIVASLGILAVSTYGLTLLAGKIYKVGALLYGKRPTLKELWKWIRY